MRIHPTVVAWGLILLSSPVLATPLILETPEILTPFAPLVMSRVAKAHLDAEVRFAPFARLQADLLNNTVDGAFFLSESILKALPGYEIVPVPLYRNEFVAVTLGEEPPIRTPQDLKGKTVAYPRGYLGMGTITEGAEVTTVVDEEQGFRILGAGRVQVLIVSKTSAQMFGAVAGRPLRISEVPLLTSLLYLALRKTLPQENIALAQVFRESIRDGSWERDVEQTVRNQTKTR